MLSTEDPQNKFNAQQPVIEVRVIHKACLIRCWTEAENITHSIKFCRGVTFSGTIKYDVLFKTTTLNRLIYLYIFKELTLAFQYREHYSTHPGSAFSWCQRPPTLSVEYDRSCACTGRRHRKGHPSRTAYAPNTKVP